MMRKTQGRWPGPVGAVAESQIEGSSPHEGRGFANGSCCLPTTPVARAQRALHQLHRPSLTRLSSKLKRTMLRRGFRLVVNFSHA